MKILFLMATENNFHPGKLSSMETLIMENGKVQKGFSKVFKVNEIIDYFQDKYKLTTEQNHSFSNNKKFEEYYLEIVELIESADLIITFDYFDYYDIFFAKEFFLASPLYKTHVMKLLHDKIIDLSIYKETHEDIYSFFKGFDKNLDTEINIIKTKLYMMGENRNLEDDPNKLRVVYLLLSFCMLVNKDILTLNNNLETEVRSFINEFFGGKFF